MARNQIEPKEFSETILLRDLDKATRRGRKYLTSGPLASSAAFDRERGLVVMTLTNGCIFEFPPSLIEELRRATPDQIAEVTLAPHGTALHWEDLDAHYTVAGLLNGVFGTRAWMSELGRKGGSKRSESKTQAARLNGAKGGRPKKILA
jgi:Protein of unknown function (DUF2442)